MTAQPLLVRLRQPRLLVALGSLLLWVACSINSPDGTRWSTLLSVGTAPETLRVSDLLEREDVTVDGDSVLLFRQELDTVWANFGDSLIWRGAHSTLLWEVGPLELGNLGSGAVDVPFVAAWPQYAGLVGGSSQITGQATCDLELPLPPWPTMEWVAFSEASFDVSIGHAWPFALQWLDISLLNSSGQSLAQLRIEPAGGIPAGVPRVDVLHLAGLMDQNCRLRVQARHLPMSAAAPITNGTLSLDLAQRSGTADSARAHIPAQTFSWVDSLASDEHIRITHAASGPMILHVNAVNTTSLGMALHFELPQFRDGPQGDPYRLDLNLAAHGSLELTDQSQSLVIQEPEGLRGIDVQAEALCVASTGMATVRAGDRVELEVVCEELELEEFQGWFAQDLLVPMPPQRTPIDQWPAELRSLALDGLDMRLHLWNNAHVTLASSIQLDVESSQGDTAYVLSPGLNPGDSLLWVHEMGRLIERLPHAITVAGDLILPAGTDVELNRESRIGIGALSVPGRGRLRSLVWRSEPELHTDEIPEEAQHLSVEARVENGLPAGGRLRGFVSLPSVGVDELLFDVRVNGAGPNGAAHDTLQLELSDAAFAVLREPEWELWYEFAADDTGGEVVVHAGQILVVHSVIRADVEVEVKAQ